MLKYDFLNNNFFTTYQSVDEPKVEILLPLMDTPLNLPWASGIAENGTPIVKDNRPNFIVKNNPEEPILTDTVILDDKKETEKSDIKPKVKLTLAGSKKAAMEFFIERGLQPHLAAGIIGNLILESNLNTSAIGDGGKAFGAALWHPDRLKGLEKLAKKLGTDKTDLLTLFEYIWEELNTTHKDALDSLLKSKNSDEATIAFMRKFEKPNEKYANLTARLKHAKSCLE